MHLMSVSQYAKHAGMSRQALYNWESKQGFPARVNGKIDQAACDEYLRQYRDSHDPRTLNAKVTSGRGQGKARSGMESVQMSVAAIRQRLADCAGQAAGMDEDERIRLATKCVGLFLSEGPYNPPVTFGGYRLATVETPEWEVGHIIAGGAFGLSASDALYDCRDYTLTLMDDETESSALREVIPDLLYTLSYDN